MPNELLVTEKATIVSVDECFCRIYRNRFRRPAQRPSRTKLKMAASRILECKASVEDFVRAQFDMLSYVKFFNFSMLTTENAIVRYEKWLTRQSSRYRSITEFDNSRRIMDFSEKDRIAKNIKRDDYLVKSWLDKISFSLEEPELSAILIHEPTLSPEYLCLNPYYKKACDDGYLEESSEVLKLKKSDFALSVIKKEMMKLGNAVLIL